MNNNPRNPLVSIIIPVYDVWDYLGSCVQSAMSQTYENIEIVLVDDGSTDGSGEMCDAWARRDNRIAVIHCSNRGISAARNTGMEHAHGEVIAFLDSDDAIAATFVQNLITPMIEFGADCASCFCQRFVGDEELGALPSEELAYYSLKSGREAIMDSFISQEHWCMDSAWGKLYKKELFERMAISFPEGKTYEDMATTYKVIFPCKSVVVSRGGYYYYRIRQGSIITKPFAMYRLDEIEAASSQIGYYHEKGDSELEMLATRSTLLRCVILWRVALGSECEKEAQEKIHEWFCRLYDEAVANGVSFGSYGLLFSSFYERAAKWTVYFPFRGSDDKFEDQVEEFCSRLFTQCLGRGYTQEDLAAQVRGVRTGMSASQIASTIFCCEECLDKGMDAEELVERVYMTMFGRCSDDEGRAFWLSKIESGLTREQLIRGFAESDEWHNWCVKYGVRP